MRDLVADLRAHPIAYTVGCLGLVASFVLLVCSTGTNDLTNWQKFAQAIQASGLGQLYRDQELFNHPPLMGIFAWLALEVSGLSGVPFAIVFKLFPFAANLGVALLLRAIWRHRVDAREGARAFALSNWALAPLLIGSFHGNTDCAVVFFCLLSVYLIDVRQRPFHGGLAIAVAINVKIIPLIVAAAVLGSFRSMKDARAFVLGAATAALPFLLALFSAGTALVSNVFGYASSPELWGVQILLATGGALPGVTQAEMLTVHTAYSSASKYLLVGAVLGLAAYGGWRRLSATQLAAGALTLFLLLSAGFGVQYLVYPVALMLALSLRQGMIFATAAGIFAAMVYGSWLTGELPLYAVYRGYHPSLLVLGFASWLVALAFLPTCLRAASGTAGASDADGTAGPRSDERPAVELRGMGAPGGSGSGRL